MNAISRLEALLTQGQFVVTGECGPPRGADLGVVHRKAAVLKGYLDAVNVTDNQTSIVRLSSIATCRILLEQGLEPVVQMVCRDRNRIALQSDVLGAYALGLRNLLCLTGDHQIFGNHPGAKNVFDIDSIQLLDIVRTMCEQGRFASGDPVKGPPRMWLGAAANPFADPFEFRVIRLAKKVAAGARFIQTQCIFDLPRFRRFMQQVVDRGLDRQVHILAGVAPLKSLGMAQHMARHVSGIMIPDAILQRIEGVPKEQRAAEGIKLCLEQIQELREIPGVHGIHLMAIEWEDRIPELVRAAGLFPRPEPSAEPEPPAGSPLPAGSGSTP